MIYFADTGDYLIAVLGSGPDFCFTGL